MSRSYQTHCDADPGVSDSHEKLIRLQIPEDLGGKSFLDIGCNEGFFCNVAAQRGASRIVGIDFSPPSIALAKERYDNPVIEYRVQRWDALPDESFDVVLWSSAMHYELDPARVIGNVARVLRPGGLFMLECGVAPGSDPEMVMVQRHNDTRWYPTATFLTGHLLKEFSFRQVSGWKAVPGDPIPRFVYHCRHRTPTVLLCRGASGHGKTSFARSFGTNATKVISLDYFIYRISVAKYQHDAVQIYIREHFRNDDLSSLYEGIDEVGLTEQYIRHLVSGIALSDGSVIIEGYMTDNQANVFVRELQGRAFVWEAQRLGVSTSNAVPSDADNDIP